MVTRLRVILPAVALAVYAAWPATRSAFALGKFSVDPFNAARTGLDKFRGFYPTNPFVSGKRRDVVPSRECGLVGTKSFSQIAGHFVNGSGRNGCCAHGAIVAYL